MTGATVNTAGWFTMRAERVGEETVLAGIIRLVDEATSSKAPIEKMADKISGVFVPVVIAIAVVVFAVWLAVGAFRGTYVRDFCTGNFMPLRAGIGNAYCHYGGHGTRCRERDSGEICRGAGNGARREDGGAG